MNELEFDVEKRWDELMQASRFRVVFSDGDVQISGRATSVSLLYTGMELLTEAFVQCADDRERKTLMDLFLYAWNEAKDNDGLKLARADGDPEGMKERIKALEAENENLRFALSRGGKENG